MEYHICKVLLQQTTSALPKSLTMGDLTTEWWGGIWHLELQLISDIYHAEADWTSLLRSLCQDQATTFQSLIWSKRYQMLQFLKWPLEADSKFWYSSVWVSLPDGFCFAIQKSNDFQLSLPCVRIIIFLYIRNAQNFHHLIQICSLVLHSHCG